MLNSRGHNAIYLPWGMPFAKNLQPTLDAPALTWNEFFEQLQAAGANLLRVHLTGENEPQGRAGVQAFEYALGQYTDWDGRLTQMVEAARAHSVGLMVAPFVNREFKRGWGLHAWNADNGGILDDARDCFTDPRALLAAENRIDAIVAACGDTIAAWEICAEMAWLLDTDFWQTDGWDAEMREIATVTLPGWVEQVAQYIHRVHHASVGNGQVFAGRHTIPDDPNHPGYLRNLIHRTPSLDYASANWYDWDDATTVQDKVDWLRQCQAYTGKPVYVQQYAPWRLGRDVPYTREPETLAWSKAHEWAAVCGEQGCVGPLRWQEIRPQGERDKWWGVAHPNLADIAGVTAEFAAVVKPERWGASQASWDDQIVADRHTLLSSWGDGSRAVLFVGWDDDTAHDVRIGLVDGEYTVRAFDYVVGDEIDAWDAETNGGQLILESVPVRDGCAALFVERIEPPPPVQQYNLVLRIGDQIVASVPVTEIAPFSLSLQEAGG